MQRRAVLRMGLVGMAGAAAHRVVWAQSEKTSYDVIVIGAGIAGLAAAHDLAKNGYDVAVLEARDRIGGRIHSDFSLGAPFEWGAGWIHGPDGNPVTALAEAADVKTFRTDDDGLVVFRADGRRVDDDDLEDLDDQIAEVGAWIDNTLDNDMPLAKALAAMSPAPLDDPLFRWAMTANTEFDTGGAIEKLSSFYFAADEMFSGDDVVPLGGYARVLEPLQAGFDVILDTQVTGIAYERGDGAYVFAGDQQFEADYVVCTLPLGVLKADIVAFDPPLPKTTRKAIEAVPMGSVTKLALKFDEPFWLVETQYLGFMTAEKGRWAYALNYRTFSDENILLMLSLGDYAFVADAMSDAEMTADALGVLRATFGARVPDPVAVLATHWSQDPFTLGAYSYAGFGSTPDDFDVLSEPVEEVVFLAGEHTNFAYHGTTHGALLTGQRAAAQIIETDS